MEDKKSASNKKSGKKQGPVLNLDELEEAPASKEQSNNLKIEVVPQKSGPSLVTAKKGNVIIFHDKLDISREKVRKATAERLAQDSGVSPADIETKLMEFAVKRGTSPVPKEGLNRRDAALKEYDEQVEQKLKDTHVDVIGAALERLKGNFFKALQTAYTKLGVIGESDLCSLAYVIAVSCKLNRPLAGLIQGPSSSGKSFVVRRTANLIPDESRIIAHDITPQALYYHEYGKLIHRAVFSGERTGSEDADTRERTKAFRELHEDGVLSKLVTVPGRASGLTTERIENPGPISFIQSTTSTRILDEDANRMIPMSTNESADATLAVLMNSATQKAGKGQSAHSEIEIMHACFRLMKRVYVVIPYEASIANHIASHHALTPSMRRTFNQILGTISTVALIRQYKKLAEPKHGDAVEAKAADYKIAMNLLALPLARMLNQELPPSTIRFGQRMWEIHGDDPFTWSEADDPEVKSKSAILRHLNELSTVGFATVVAHGAGPKPDVWCMVGEVPDSVPLTFPEFDELK